MLDFSALSPQLPQFTPGHVPKQGQPSFLTPKCYQRFGVSGTFRWPSPKPWEANLSSLLMIKSKRVAADKEPALVVKLCTLFVFVGVYVFSRCGGKDLSQKARGGRENCHWARNDSKQWHREQGVTQPATWQWSAVRLSAEGIPHS